MHASLCWMHSANYLFVCFVVAKWFAVKRTSRRTAATLQCTREWITQRHDNKMWACAMFTNKTWRRAKEVVFYCSGLLAFFFALSWAFCTRAAFLGCRCIICFFSFDVVGLLFCLLLVCDWLIFFFNCCFVYLCAIPHSCSFLCVILGESVWMEARLGARKTTQRISHQTVSRGPNANQTIEWRINECAWRRRQ